MEDVELNFLDFDPGSESGASFGLAVMNHGVLLKVLVLKGFCSHRHNRMASVNWFLNGLPAVTGNNRQIRQG